MKSFKILALGAALAALTPLAHATPISGQISIFGFDTFTNTAITFTPSTGTVVASAGDLAVPTGTSVTLSSFSYATSTSANGVNLFSTPVNGISFVIDSITSATYTAPSNMPNPGDGAGEVIIGTGLFSRSGLTPTEGSFSLSTNTTGFTTFTINGASPLSSVTPEPSSLILLGTGLMSAAGMMIRRRRIA